MSLPNVGDLLVFNKPPRTDYWTDCYDEVSDTTRDYPLECVPGTTAVLLHVKKNIDGDEEYPIVDVLVNGILSCGWLLDSFCGYEGFTECLVKEKFLHANALKAGCEPN